MLTFYIPLHCGIFEVHEDVCCSDSCMFDRPSLLYLAVWVIVNCRWGMRQSDSMIIACHAWSAKLGCSVQHRYSHVLKTDDDCYVRVSKLVDLVKKLASHGESMLYAGRQVCSGPAKCVINYGP